MILERFQDSKPVNKTDVIPLDMQRETKTWKPINNATFMASKATKYLRTNVTKYVQNVNDKTVKI